MTGSWQTSTDQPKRKDNQARQRYFYIARFSTVVTGGGSETGRELSLLLLKKGARVAAVDINEAALKETAALAGENQGRLSIHVANITDRDAISALPEAVIQAHGTVDGIINNDGFPHPSDARTRGEDDLLANALTFA